MEINFTILEPWLTVFYVIAGIMLYSVFAGITAGIAARYGYDGNVKPPAELVGVVWQECAVALVVLFCFGVIVVVYEVLSFIWRILSWTIFLPAWVIYNTIVNYKSDK